MLCNCVRCGKQFEAKVKTAVCADCHTAVCVVCGNEFSLKSPWTQLTCSSKCRGIYRKQSGIAKASAMKAKKTVEDKYGVSGFQKIEKQYHRICKYCGKEFDTTSSRQVYCDDIHYGTCPVCGGPSVVRDFSNPNMTCSEECRVQQIRLTTKDRYGEDCVFKSEEFKEKSKETNLEKYGVEHYSQTKEYKDLMSSILPEKYRESEEQRIATNFERYGVPYPMMNDDIKKKSRETFEREHGGIGWGSPEIYDTIRSTLVARYGTTSLMKVPEIYEKAYATLVEHYGDHPYSADEIVEKRRKTSLDRYGTIHPSQSQEVKDKKIATNRRRRNVDNVFQDPEVKAQIAATMKERYGCTNPRQNPDIIAKSEDTCWGRYGNKTYKGSDEDFRRTLADPSKMEQFKSFKSDVKHYIESHYKENPTLLQLASDIGCNIATVSRFVIEQECQNLISYTHISYAEQDVIDFLKEYLDDSEIKLHDRQVISPKEIDIYLPSLKIGFEINPTYTHNSSKSTHHDNTFIVPANYHFNKTVECESKGVRLFHVFGYQWTLKPDIVKSMILNAIGKTTNVYYARKLSLRTVSDAESKRFLNENHIQGYTTSKVRIGLCNEDELICVMTFSRKRGTMGHKDSDTKDDWDLTRFCTKNFSRCIGGASKLFKYFVEEYKPSSVVSFSDRSNTSGGLYSILGFEFDSFVPPGYVWVDAKTDFYYNRVSTQKNNLRKLFNEPSINIEEKTETQIMEEHGFVKVYNSGLVKWMWKVGET